MEILKTKEAAELLSVSQTTIKRWAAMFPDFFPKDRLGHYTFSKREISQLNYIKDRINQGKRWKASIWISRRTTCQGVRCKRS